MREYKLLYIYTYTHASGNYNGLFSYSALYRYIRNLQAVCDRFIRGITHSRLHEIHYQSQTHERERERHARIISCVMRFRSVDQ